MALQGETCFSLCLGIHLRLMLMSFNSAQQALRLRTTSSSWRFGSSNVAWAGRWRAPRNGMVVKLFDTSDVKEYADIGRPKTMSKTTGELVPLQCSHHYLRPQAQVAAQIWCGGAAAVRCSIFNPSRALAIVTCKCDMFFKFPANCARAMTGSHLLSNFVHHFRLRVHVDVSLAGPDEWGGRAALRECLLSPMSQPQKD